MTVCEFTSILAAVSYCQNGELGLWLNWHSLVEVHCPMVEDDAMEVCPGFLSPHNRIVLPTPYVKVNVMFVYAFVLQFRRAEKSQEALQRHLGWLWACVWG